VSRLSDRLFELELDLAKNDGDGEHAALDRRIILRKALTDWGDERFQEGYHEGRRDVFDARSEARRRADNDQDPAPEAAGTETGQ